MDSRFSFESKIVYNSAADSNNIFFLESGFLGHIFIEDTTEVALHSILYGYSFHYQDNFRKFPITPNLWIGLGSGGYFEISSPHDPFSNYAEVGLSMSKLDNSFKDFAFHFYQRHEQLYVNNKNQCLIPFESSDESQVKFLLINTVVEDMGYEYFVDTLSTKIIPRPENEPERINFSYLVNCIEDKFYLTGIDETYLLSADEEFHIIDEHSIRKIFKIDGVYYGLTYKAEQGVKTFKMLSSYDGINWQVFADPVREDLHLFNYKEIDGKTLAYIGDHIIHFYKTDVTIEFKEISNIGLEGNQITSISEFNGRVYVTTLSGVFIKDIEDFWKYKEDEQLED
ncbi:hypothetical protein V6R21_17805 [Limibacter armeniacum]|uniref:hypothetical protein n=1 Tax=Limibacter armeniacum TaxID=466084 RepID=UPI002FE5FC8D